MPIAIHFEEPPGVTIGRQFEPGQDLRIVVAVQNWDGLPGAFLHTIIEIYPENNEFSPIYMTGTTNVAGHIYKDTGNGDFQLPGVVSKGIVRVTVDWSVGSNEVAEIPIGIGVTPDPVPGETNWLKMLATGAVVFGFGFLAIQLVNRRKS